MNHYKTPPVSTNHNARGFTLSELLISLSVLGLISALTLPSVFNSVEEKNKKAVFKETLNSLQQLLSTEAALGGASQRSLDLVKKGLNAKECSNRLSITRPADRNDRFGCVLQTGAYIMHLNGTGTSESITLDWNGNAEPNAFGQDRMVLLVNWSGQEVANLSGYNVLAQTGRSTLRPGEILPTLGTRPLYEEIF